MSLCSFLITQFKSANVAILSLALLVSMSLACNSQAQTIVRVNTTVGEYYLELFDDIAPGTVANFLNYVKSGSYDQTVVHRSEPNFVIQGGWLTFNAEALTLNPIPTNGNIINEFNVSNTRGTIAMAKLPGDPDSANSQWFINLANNTNLDTDNGGFTVFGRVQDNGMDVVDAIAALPRGSISGSPFPLYNYDGVNFSGANLVYVEMSVYSTGQNNPNYFDGSTGLLNLSIDASNGASFTLSFSVFAIEPNIVVQAIIGSLVELESISTGFSTFDLATSQLIIPELVIDGAVAFRNLVFILSDLDQFLFTLQSFE